MCLSAYSAAPATSFGSSACCSARARPSCWTWCGPRPSCCSPPARVSADAGLGGLAPGGACGCRASPPHGPLPGPEGHAMHAVMCAHAMWAGTHSHTPIHMPTHMLSHTYMHTRTHACAQKHARALTYVHMHNSRTCTHADTCACTLRCTPTHAHTCACPHVCTHMQACVCMCSHTRVHACMYTCAHTDTFTCFCTHADTYMQCSLYIHMHTCARMCTCMHMHINAGVCALTHTQVHTCVYMLSHTRAHTYRFP